MTDPRYPGPGQPYGGQSPYGGGPPNAPDPYGQPDPYRQPDPYAPQAPYGGQPDSGQPYSGQPYSGQPYSGQPYSGQPYSGDPYGTTPQQSPYGAPPQQGAYGAPPQNPYGGYGSPAPYPAPPAKGGSGKVIAAVVVVVAVLALLGVGAAVLLSNKAKPTNQLAPGTGSSSGAQPSHTPASHAPTSAAPTVKNTDSLYAKVGDCLAGQAMDSTTATEVDNVSIVPCTSADAKYKVIGIVANKTEAQFNADDNVCGAYPTAVSALWQGRTGGSGKVLCLADAKKK